MRARMSWTRGGLIVAVSTLAILGCVARGIPPGTEMIPVTALTAGTHAKMVAVFVNVPDTLEVRRVDLRVRDGMAEGTIPVERGAERLIWARGYDAEGLVTHAGEIRIDVQGGEVSYTAFRMLPRAGESPLALWIGSQEKRAIPAVTLNIGDGD